MIAFSFSPEFTPVIKVLDREVLALHLQYGQQLKEQGIPVRVVGEFAQGSEGAAFDAASRFIAAAVGLRSTNGLSPKASAFLSEKLAAVLYGQMYELCLLVVALDRANPEVVVLHNDVEPLTKVCALWARERGVPCLHVPHAVYQIVNRGPLGTDVHDIVTSSHLAVAGSFQRKWYEGCGVDPERIRETGLPQFDGWAEPRTNRSLARAQLGLAPDGPVISYMSTWPQHTNKGGMNDGWAELYRAFLGAVSQLPGAQFIVKTHPRAAGNSMQWHGQEAKKAGVTCKITAHHLEQVIHASDAIVAFGGSNVLIEAAHVPGVRLLTNKGMEEDPEVYRVNTNPDEMATTLKKALGQPAPDSRNLAHKYAGTPDGKAYLRIARYIKELATREEEPDGQEEQAAAV